ncbi:AbrB/MazE/SpoVT family DNA-binding domain-containing protein [Patescibacteria group bacterium]|nr:AbrB/MazE/SpoVT family DNA-binding domain-containing protein [Patescibacteria group bacterium]
MTQVIQSNQEEWLKVLGKGMVTIPKKWREEMGIASGDIVKAKKVGNRMIIDAAGIKAIVPYRVYSTAEIDEFLKEDKLPEDLARKVEKSLSNIP